MLTIMLVSFSRVFLLLSWLRPVWGDAQHQGRAQIQCRDTALNSAWTVAGWGEGRTLMIQYSSPLWTAI